GRFQGDGGPAIRALLNQPDKVAAGPDGTLYVFDLLNCRLRAVSPNGVILTVAGTGNCLPAFFSSDDQPALEADVGVLQGLACHSSGRIYFSGPLNEVKKITPDGRLQTVVQGDPDGGFSGDGGPAINADLQSYDDELTALFAGLGLAVDSAGK